MFRGRICTFFACMAMLGSCGQDMVTRGTSGAGLGAGTALLMLGNPLLGAAAGAGLGAITNQQQIDLGPAPYNFGGYGTSPQPAYQYGYYVQPSPYGQYAPQPYQSGVNTGYGGNSYPNANYAPTQAYCPPAEQFQQPYPATQFDAYGRPICQVSGYQRNNQNGSLNGTGASLLGAFARAGSLSF